MTSREKSNINILGNGCGLKESKSVIHRAEALIEIDTGKLKARPPIPTIKDTVQINKQASIKPSIPTIKETVHLNSHVSVLKTNEVNKRKLINSFDEQKSAKKTQLNEKNTILEKKKFAEERKKRLDELQKTIRKVAKDSVKKKIIHVTNESQIAHNNIPSKIYQPEIDQTWSPPPKLKSHKKTTKTPVYFQKNVIKDQNDDDNKSSKITRNIKNIIPTFSKNTGTTQKKLIEKKPLIRDVTKPEDLYKGNQSIYNSIIFDIPTPNLENNDTSFIQNENEHNVSLTEEICHNEKLQVENDVTCNEKISDMNLSAKFIDTPNIDHEKNVELKLPNKLNEDINQNIDNSVEFQELLFNQCLSRKKCSSESTQTDDFNNLSSLFSSKRPPPPMNFISVLKCKYRLLEIENDNLEFSKSIADLRVKECTISNSFNNKNYINKSVEGNIQEELDDTRHLSNFNCNERKHLNDDESSLTNEIIKSDQNGISMNHVTEENISNKKLQIENNDKLNITYNEGNQHVMNKLNCDFECLTKISSYNNDNSNKYLNDNESSLTNEINKSNQNSISMNHITEENISNKKLQIENNDKLNITYNEGSQHVLKKLNCDLECLTKISSYNNDNSNKYLNDNESSLTNEINKSNQNSISMNHVTEENISNKKLQIENNDKLNITYNEGSQHVLKKLNCDLECLTKISSYNNDNSHNVSISKDFKKCEANAINKTWPYFSEIHDEFKAELNLLEQLNDSLCDIEKMSSNKSIQNNEQTNAHYPINDFNFETSFNGLLHNNNKPTQFSKINDLSSNMMSVDKTITSFSIQMFEQLIKDEELRAKQHHTILNLKEKSLTNRLTWEGTMYDLQMRNLKNQSGYEKQLQLLKQKQRGSIKKLENSLSQIKRLRRVIDSVYKQRLIILEEQLQHLKMQSSSKKVIRKLKSLDQISKKEEFTNQPLNSNISKRCNKTDFYNAIENEDNNVNLIEFNSESSNNTSSPAIVEDKSKIVFKNQAISPINIGKTIFKPTEIANDQTELKWILPPQPVINKSIETSSTVCNHISLKNSNSTDLIHQNELFYVNKIMDEPLLPQNSSISLVNPKGYISETSNSTNSEQSDIDVRITELEEKLETRKSEFSKIKNKQKKLRTEYLKAKEQELLKQIELYDNKIEKSKKNLLAEVEKKNIQLTKSSMKHDSSSKQSKFSIFEKVNYDYDRATEKHGQNLPMSDKITWTDGKEFFYPKITNQTSNNELKTLKSAYELPQQNAFTPIKHLSLFSNNSNSIIVDYSKLRKQLFQYLETNKVCETVPLQNDSTILEVNSFKESQYIQSNSQSVEISSHPTKNHEVNLQEDNFSCNINDVHINPEGRLCEYSIPHVEMLNKKNNQDSHIENNTNVLNITTSCSSINNDSSTSSSTSSNIQRTPNENDNNLFEEKEDNVSRYNILNIETDDYSTDFTSDENTPEFLRLNEINKHNSIIESQMTEENESSYEEERSEGDIMFEDKTFIEKYSGCSDVVQNEKHTENEVDNITNNIFYGLLKDIKILVEFNNNKALLTRSEKSDLNNLTGETPLLMILKREEELKNMILLSEQATSISKALLKRHLQPIISEAFIYLLPRLNEMEQEKLKVYLNWSCSKRKKLKLSKYFKSQHKTDDVENDESFEIFYLKYHEQKSLSFHNENSDVMLCQTQKEAEKLKLEQIRIEEEIERLRMTEDVQIFLREIPNKPPPPYKSPTKIKSLIDMPYTSDEMHKIVLMATNQLFKDSQSSMSTNYIINFESSLHADYKKLIFDYCKEIIQDTFINEKNAPIWERSVKTLKQFRARPKNPIDLSDVVLKKMEQIIEIDECEEKVNKFVIKQMHEEDSKWTDFEMDEMVIQNNIVQNIMKKLISDTIINIKTNFYLKFI